MFELTLIDHLRLTFGDVIARHEAHSHLARTQARRNRRLQGLETFAMAAVALTALGAALREGRVWAVASAVLAAIALIVLVLRLTLDLERTARAHAVCASALWAIRERYRTVLSDLRDGTLDPDAARVRRDVLAAELHSIYETAPPEEARSFRAAGKLAVEEGSMALTDEEVDFFLPMSLRKARGSAT